jgi:hypothetical protein
LRIFAAVDKHANAVLTSKRNLFFCAATPMPEATDTARTLRACRAQALTVDGISLRLPGLLLLERRCGI